MLCLRGDQAATFTLAQAGATDVPDHLTGAMAGLIDLGIVESDTWSRRRIIQLGGSSSGLENGGSGVVIVAYATADAAGLTNTWDDQTLGTGPATVESVRLDPDLRKDLADRAQADGVTASEIIREALRRFLKTG